MAEIYLKKKKRNRTLTKTRKQASQIYNTVRWRKLRAWYLRENPLCEDCLEQDKTVPAAEVHHEIPWQTGHTKEAKIRLAFDSDNLISLCLECHHRKHPHSHRNNFNSQ
ncbi:hypothetical protein ES705_18745 [subsurface metagenome]